MRKSAFIIGFATVLALVLVMLCSPTQAGSSFIQDSIADGSLVLYHDYRAGHTQDLSGQGNHGTISGATWASDGLIFQTSTAKVTVSDAAELQLTAGTIVVLRRNVSGASLNLQHYVSKRDAGGTNYDMRWQGASSISLFDGAAAQACAIVGGDVDVVRYISANFANGATVDVYTDGTFECTTAGSVSITTDDAPLDIGNNYLNNLVLEELLEAVLIFNDELTATENAKLYAELTSLTWPSKGNGTGQGTYGAELVVDGDMETAGTAAWAVGSGAVLTKQTNWVLGGVQVLRVAHGGTTNPNTTQTILTVGKEYRISGWGRGDGTGLPVVGQSNGFLNLWFGTSSTGWQHFDVTYTATGDKLRLQCNIAVAGNCEFDNVTVTEVSADYTQFKSDWNAKVTSNVTSNYVHDTELSISSGAYKVEVQTVKNQDSKVLECTNAGIAGVYGRYIQGDTTQDAYGTWEFTFNKSAGGSIYASFVMDEAASSGYFVLLNATEQIILYEIPAGTTHFATAASYFNDSTWYTLKVTRQQSDGEMTVYLDDVLVDPSGGSGTNPVSDATHTTSEVFVFDMDAGDKVSIGTKGGDYAISKKHGVQ